MLQTSFSFKDASWAMASVGPRPKVARLLVLESEQTAFAQSSSAATARRSGRRSRAALIARSATQWAIKFSKMATDATKVFVAAALNTGPAAMGRTMSQVDARGLSVSLTIATVSAPKALADEAASTRSPLRPD